MKYVGWVAAGGIGVGIVASALLAVASADDNHGFGWNQFLSATNDCYDSKAAGVAEPEHHWAWDGGDSVTIAVPGTVHYRRGEGNEVIVRGEPTLVGHVHVHDGRIEMSCHGSLHGSGLDITLPGRDFRDVALEGSAHLVMENVSQPELALSIGGSGAIRVSGSADKASASVGGSGNITFADLAMKELHANIAGSGQIGGTGRSDIAEASISGSGGIDLADVPMKAITVSIAGSGGIEAAPQDKADITIRGSGNVTLSTHPEHINTSIMGSGRVIQGASKVTNEG